MWHLNYPAPDDLKKYKQRLLNPLKDSIRSATNLGIRNTLLPINSNGTEDDSSLIGLLTFKPQELYRLNNDLISSLINGYNDTEFEAYLIAKGKQDCDQEPLYIKYHDMLESLLNIFNYEKKISKNKSRSYMIARMKGRDSCTYCNRQYTQTIVRDGGTNDDNRIARPQLDHWFSQELFPLMSLSFFNLIPSCSICNSTAKGNAIFRFHTHIHPYFRAKSNPDFYFNYKAGFNGEWEIEIENDADVQEQNMVDAFHLREVYKYHSKLELKDILDFSLGNNDTYLDTLLNQTLIKFPHKTKEDIYCMFFGTKLHEEDFLDRPMSKFKYDILKKVGVIDKLRNR